MIHKLKTLKKMKRIVFLDLFILFVVGLNAQVFTHSLNFSASVNGLQALALPAELRNIATSNLSDVRLYDSKGKEAPYFLVNESFNYKSASFKEYKVIDKETGKGRYTRFTIENNEKKKIDHVILNIMNSDAWKLCDITGSDDNKEWFSVSDHIFLYHMYDDDQTHSYRSIHFPAVNYKYIKFEINDLSTKPINILKAGYFDGCISAGKLNVLAGAKIQTETNEKEKITSIKVEFANPSIIDKISFRIKAPNLFKRTAVIYLNKNRTVKKREETYREQVMEFELNSDNSNSFEVRNFREKNFEIEIRNNDNQALEIENIEFAQLQSYLVADLKAGEKCVLKVGDKKLNFPVYDIENFRSKINGQMTINEAGELKVIPVAAIELATPEVKLWQEPWFMWVCISVASLLLLVFSIKVLKDMKN